MNKVRNILAGGIAISGLIVGGSAFADQVKNKAKDLAKELEGTEAHDSTRRHKSREGWDLGNGWKLNTTGGLSYVNPQNADYWVKLSGVIRLDETAFMGSYRDKAAYLPNGAAAGTTPSKITNGALVRVIETYLDGGLGENWEYTFSLSYGGGQSTKVTVSDTWLSYTGLMENNQVYVGRVPGNWFGLDSANSTSWNPFLERSMQANAFYPGDGLGAMTDFWWENGGVVFIAFMLEGEYTTAFVHRVNNNLGTLRFDGWNLQTRYLLTGEHHAYDVRDGNFGTVIPNAHYGAVEVVARYDFLNLNNKDVRGGTEHDVSVGLNWFVSQQIRVSANYIRASIHPNSDQAKRNLDIVAARLQLKFK